ncbi:MAG TPA: hypothetical protein VGF64_08635 [Acidimicrobiales bacterium]
MSRRLWGLFEPYHSVLYFAPEARARYDEAGLRGFWMGYFAGRSAPMGAVGPGIVVATFYNFKADMVRRAIPDAWSFASPGAVLDARLGAVDHALRRLIPDEIGSPALSEAADLAQAAAMEADVPGRPLYAANAELAWPDEPHMVLWQATTCLREHRGDGHVAALMAAGVDGCQAHLTLAGTGRVSRDVLQPNRGWTDDDWKTAADQLIARGWLDGQHQLTDEGRGTRAAIEDRTDRLAETPWSRLGERRAERLAELLRPIARGVVSAGGVPVPNPIGVPEP